MFIQLVPHNISVACMDDPSFKYLNVLYGPPPKCSFYSFAFSERIYFDPRQDLGRDRVRDLVRSGSLRQQSKSHMVSFSVFSFVSIFQPFSLSFWSKTGSLNNSHTPNSMNLFQCFRCSIFCCLILVRTGSLGQQSKSHMVNFFLFSFQFSFLLVNLVRNGPLGQQGKVSTSSANFRNSLFL